MHTVVKTVLVHHYVQTDILIKRKLSPVYMKLTRFNTTTKKKFDVCIPSLKKISDVIYRILD